MSFRKDLSKVGVTGGRVLARSFLSKPSEKRDGSRKEKKERAIRVITCPRPGRATAEGGVAGVGSIRLSQCKENLKRLLEIPQRLGGGKRGERRDFRWVLGRQKKVHAPHSEPRVQSKTTSEKHGQGPSRRCFFDPTLKPRPRFNVTRSN